MALPLQTGRLEISGGAPQAARIPITNWSPHGVFVCVFARYYVGVLPVGYGIYSSPFRYLVLSSIATIHPSRTPDSGQNCVITLQTLSIMPDKKLRRICYEITDYVLFHKVPRNGGHKFPLYPSKRTPRIVEWIHVTRDLATQTSLSNSR